MAYYDQYLDGVLKNLDVLYNKKRDELRGQLAGRPKSAVDYQLTELQKSYLGQLDELVPKLQLQQEETRYNRGLQDRELGLRESQATMGASQNQQQIDEQRRMNMINEILKQREIDLQEQGYRAQQDAYGAEQRDWWKPVLGTLVGGVGGMVGGGYLNKLLGLTNPYLQKGAGDAIASTATSGISGGGGRMSSANYSLTGGL